MPVDPETGAFTSWDPTAAAQLQALQAQSAASIAQNPQNWKDTGPFGALAQALGGAVFPQRAVADVQGIQQARQGQYPDLLRALAAPDPASYAAMSGMNPLAQAMMLQMETPSTVAATRLQGAQAQQAAAEAARTRLQTSGYSGIPTGPGQGGAPVAPTAPAGLPTRPAFGPGSTGRPNPTPGAPTPGAVYGTPGAPNYSASPYYTNPYGF